MDYIESKETDMEPEPGKLIECSAFRATLPCELRNLFLEQRPFIPIGRNKLT